jgi:microcompartment protein CcmL/EutN
MEKALGVIETIGLVPAIEAADIGLKTADVALGGLEKSGAGLVAVVLRGDVSSVREAVDAGKRAAERLGTVWSTTVIARTAEGLEDLGFGSSQPVAPVAASGPAAVGTSATESEREDNPTMEQLTRLSVVDLRAFVRTLDGFPMARPAIRSARRQELLEKVASYYKERGVIHG